MDVVLRDSFHLTPSVHMLWVVGLRLGNLGTGRAIYLQCVNVVVRVFIRTVIKVAFRGDPQLLSRSFSLLCSGFLDRMRLLLGFLEVDYAWSCPFRGGWCLVWKADSLSNLLQESLV